MDAAAQASVPFIRNLASSDRKLRTRSLSQLQHYILHTDISPADSLKIWTGLFYALWMTDRPPAQLALASDLASLLVSKPTRSFLSGFWAVLSAQWTGIDALRMDKFLALVRRGFAAHVRIGLGEQEVVRSVLAEGCFGEGVALGLRLHVLDVWVDEMEREGALDAGVVRVVGEVVEGLRRCSVRSVRERAEESYGDARLPWSRERDGDGDDGSWDGISDE